MQAQNNKPSFHPHRLMARLPLLLLLTTAPWLLTQCKTLPAVPLTTPEPLKVDLNMRLDVYQYRGDEPEDGDKEELKSLAEAVERQRNRMAEVQELKNNRLVGEDHRGLLQLRQTPAGQWGDYVKRTVNEENDDRMLLMRNEAKESSRQLHQVQAEAWRLRSEQAFKGEYIEVADKAPGTFKWAQAEGQKDQKPAPTNGATIPPEPPAAPAEKKP